LLPLWLLGFCVASFKYSLAPTNEILFSFNDTTLLIIARISLLLFLFNIIFNGITLLFIAHFYLFSFIVFFFHWLVWLVLLLQSLNVLQLLSIVFCRWLLDFFYFNNIFFKFSFLFIIIIYFANTSCIMATVCASYCIENIIICIIISSCGNFVRFIINFLAYVAGFGVSVKRFGFVFDVILLLSTSLVIDFLVTVAYSSHLDLKLFSFITLSSLSFSWTNEFILFWYWSFDFSYITDILYSFSLFTNTNVKP